MNHSLNESTGRGRVLDPQSLSLFFSEKHLLISSLSRIRSLPFLFASRRETDDVMAPPFSRLFPSFPSHSLSNSILCLHPLPAPLDGKERERGREKLRENQEMLLVRSCSFPYLFFSTKPGEGRKGEKHVCSQPEHLTTTKTQF